MKSRSHNKYFFATLCFLLLFQEAFAGATEQKLQGFYAWAKPLVNVVLAISTLFMVGKAVYKTFFKHTEAAMEWTMFILGIVLWALWATFANDILTSLGGSGFQF